VVLRKRDVRRFEYGHFVRPATETGTGYARLEPALGYAVELGDHVLLFDTGIARADPETDAHYRPHRRPFTSVLAEAGVNPTKVAYVVNSHLHFDHCGGNRTLPGIPIVVQSIELSDAQRADYTVLEAINFPGARYEQIDGEQELFPGIWIIPTPGHSEGHQSLVVQCIDGTVVLAGQSHEFSYDYGSDLLSLRVDPAADFDDDVPAPPSWVKRIAAFEPVRILFAHDMSVLEP
jgi:N-acyl homoserine lactone hydrolase